MNAYNNKKYKWSFLLLALWSHSVLMAQTTAEATTAANAAAGASSSYFLNFFLLFVAFVLLIPIYMLSETFMMAVRMLARKHNKTLGLLLLLGLSAQSLMAQDATTAAATSGGGFSNTTLSYFLGLVILVEILLICYLGYETSRTLHLAAREEGYATETESWWEKIWNNMNRFQPLSEEAKLDAGHNYDGIRELNNITPPWFTAAFIGTIIFAGIYMWRYHIAETAPLPLKEYELEMIAAHQEREALLKSQGSNVDENSVKMLADADISEGQSLFVRNCAPCHEAHGGSKKGGVGPNLTDDYWLHDGSLSGVFKSVKYGWPDKGMIAWEKSFTPHQIAQISSFIKSIHGTNPEGAKEPQGELFKEAAAAPADSTQQAAPAAADSTGGTASVEKKPQ